MKSPMSSAPGLKSTGLGQDVIKSGGMAARAEVGGEFGDGKSRRTILLVLPPYCHKAIITALSNRYMILLFIQLS